MRHLPTIAATDRAATLPNGRVTRPDIVDRQNNVKITPLSADNVGPCYSALSQHSYLYCNLNINVYNAFITRTVSRASSRQLTF